MYPVSDPSMIAPKPMPQLKPAGPSDQMQAFSAIMDATRAKLSNEDELEAMKTSLADAKSPDEMWDAILEYLDAPDMTAREEFASMLSLARRSGHPLAMQIEKLREAHEAVREATLAYTPDQMELKEAGAEIMDTIQRAISVLQQQIEEEMDIRSTSISGLMRPPE